MGFRHATCKCCGDGCVLTEARANCSDEDGNPYCAPGGVFPGCGPISVEFNVADLDGRSEIPDLNLYPDGITPFRWTHGTTVGIQVNEWRTTCGGEEFSFHSLRIVIGCPENPSPDDAVEILVYSRFAEFEIPETCESCTITITANYRLCSPTDDCSQCPYDIPDGYAMTAAISTPYNFAQATSDEYSAPGGICDELMFDSEANPAYGVCPGYPELGELVRVVDRTFLQAALDSKQSAIDNAPKVAPLKFSCGSNFATLVSSGVTPPFGIPFMDPEGNTWEVAICLGDLPGGSPAFFSSNWRTNLELGLTMVFDPSELVNGNLIGYIQAFAIVTGGWVAAHGGGVVGPGAPGVCQFFGHHGSSTAERFPASGTELLGTFTPSNETNCTEDTLCNAILAAFVDKNPYVISNHLPTPPNGYSGAITFRVR